MNRNKKTYSWKIGALLTAMFITSCTQEITTDTMPDSSTTVLKADIASYQANGSNATLPEELEIKDISACLFEKGVLTTVYENFQKEDKQFILKLDKQKGNLYIVANTDHMIDLHQMAADGISEQEWLTTTINTTDGQAANFMSGAVCLDEQTQTPIPLTLKRGVARFDLQIRTDQNVSVQRMVLKNVAQSVYLLPQTEITTPDITERQELDINFTEAVTTDKPAAAYVYEQKNPDLKIELIMDVDGIPTIKEASLPTIIKRNAVYTLTIRKDQVTADIKLEVKEWENGGDYELAPETETLRIDTETSVLPSNVTVNEAKNKIFFPYTATEATLQIACNEELELLPNPDFPFAIEALGGTSPETTGKNVFRIRKEKWRPGMEGKEVKVCFRRKGLQQTYPDDYLTVALERNPTNMEGLIRFDHSSECDFGRYIDNELGVITLPEGKKVEVTYEAGEGNWIKLEAKPDMPNAYRILAGWKPNDPTANGRKQKAKLIISNTADNSDMEEYTIVRRNWGLPVTYQMGTWWCKYNAKGDSKNFADQILSSDDPAAKAGKTLYEYLGACSPEEFFELWKWQYQGKSSMGLQVTDVNGVAKLAGYGPSSVHINKVDPKELAPDGYEMAAKEDFDRVLKSTTGTIWLMWDGSHKTAWSGASNIQRRNRRRNDITVGSITMTDIIYIGMYDQAHPEHEPLVWYGSSAQWNDNGIHHGHYNNMLWAVSSPQTGQGWYFAGAMNAFNPGENGAGSNDSRLLRFKKSPVEYIYE